MAAIIPRWEWRAFGAAADAFAELTPGPVQERDELYLLSAADQNVKVRGVGLDGHANTSYPRGLAALDRAEIDRQIERYRSRDTEARRAIVGLQPKRADVVLAGASIVRTVMDKLGQQTLTVSDRGLRHGLLVDRFG